MCSLPPRFPWAKHAGAGVLNAAVAKCGEFTGKIEDLPHEKIHGVDDIERMVTQL